jgi:hypothetical protein
VLVESEEAKDNPVTRGSPFIPLGSLCAVTSVAEVGVDGFQFGRVRSVRCVPRRKRMGPGGEPNALARGCCNATRPVGQATPLSRRRLVAHPVMSSASADGVAAEDARKVFAAEPV